MKTDGMVYRVWYLVTLGIFSLALVACSPTTQGTAVARKAEILREEQTSEKLLERGRAFANVHDYTRAEQYLSAAMSEGAPANVVLPLLLKVCIEENRYRAAIQYAEPELTSHPDDYRLRFVVASLYAGVGDSSTALKHLARAAETKPDYAEVQFAMAVLLRDAEHDPVRADAHFREYLRLEPQGIHAREARGSLLKTMPDELTNPSSELPQSQPASKEVGNVDSNWKTVP